MSKLRTIVFTGASGARYQFDIYSWDTEFNAVGAVYFITRRTVSRGKSSHQRIYVGETGDLSTRFDNHHKVDCFEEYQANCKCIHRDGNKRSRLAKEEDLIENYNPPCND